MHIHTIAYTQVGLGQQSSSLRAAALSMLVIVAQKNESEGGGGVTLVMPVLDKLKALKDDTWWEVSAQVCIYLGAVGCLNRVFLGVCRYVAVECGNTALSGDIWREMSLQSYIR